MAPLKVALGVDPRNPLSDDLPEFDYSTERQAKAVEIVEQTKAVQDLARKAALKTQEAQQTQANKKRRPVDFAVGDRVFVKKKGFTTAAPTTRLDSQFAGPWTIVEERGFSYVLDIPQWFKGKNLFHADRLRKAPDNPLPGQHVIPEEPEEINGQPEWNVETVLASRVSGRSKVLQYQVAWQGCDPDEQWYPAENFKNAATKLDSFHKTYPQAAGPPIHLQNWINAAAEDRAAEDLEDDNVAEHMASKTKKHPTRHK